jgi:hypothetical protein
MRRWQEGRCKTARQESEKKKERRNGDEWGERGGRGEGGRLKGKCKGGEGFAKENMQQWSSDLVNHWRVLKK